MHEEAAGGELVVQETLILVCVCVVLFDRQIYFHYFISCKRYYVKIERPRPDQQSILPAYPINTEWIKQQVIAVLRNDDANNYSTESLTSISPPEQSLLSIDLIVN